MRLGSTSQALLHLPDDFPVFDADSNLTVHVTERHIKVGRPNSPDGCAISVAQREGDPHLLRVEAFKTVVFLVYEDHAVRYVLGKRTRDAIQAFDSPEGKKMKPDTYVLLAPVRPEHQLGGREHTGSSDHPRPAKNPRDKKVYWIRGQRPAEK